MKKKERYVVAWNEKEKNLESFYDLESYSNLVLNESQTGFGAPKRAITLEQAKELRSHFHAKDQASIYRLVKVARSSRGK